MAENNDLFQFDNFSGVEDRTPEADIQTEEITASISENDAVDNEEPHNTDAGSYNDDAIQHLDWNEHIRRLRACISVNLATAVMPKTAYTCS